MLNTATQMCQTQMVLLARTHAQPADYTMNKQGVPITAVESDKADKMPGARSRRSKSAARSCESCPCACLSMATAGGAHDAARGSNWRRGRRSAVEVNAAASRVFQSLLSLQVCLFRWTVLRSHTHSGRRNVSPPFTRLAKRLVAACPGGGCTAG